MESRGILSNYFKYILLIYKWCWDQTCLHNPNCNIALQWQIDDDVYVFSQGIQRCAYTYTHTHTPTQKQSKAKNKIIEISLPAGLLKGKIN